MILFRVPLLVVLTVLALPHPGAGQQSGAGVGLLLGSAVGLAGKTWVNSSYGAAGGLGLDLSGRTALHAHADYLVHSAEAPQRLAFFRGLGGDGLFLAYYGAGARLRLGGGSRLGVRLPAGLLYAAGRSSWDGFLELVPVVDVLPDGGWSLTAFLGARFYLEGRPRRPASPAF